MPAVEHIGARRHHGARGHNRVVRCQEPAFSGIHVLVGLRREGGRLAEISRLPVPPAGPHGVGAILDQAYIKPVADLHQPVHVGDVAAHMGQQQEAGPRIRRLRLEVVHVDVIVGIDIHQHRHAADIVNRPRNRCQRIGVGQHLVARRDPAGPQRKLDGVAARCAGHAVIDLLPLGVFAFQLAGFVRVAFGQVVAVKTAALHDLYGAFDRGRRNGFLLGEGFGEFRPCRHGIPRLNSCHPAGRRSLAPNNPRHPIKSAGESLTDRMDWRPAFVILFSGKGHRRGRA